MVLNILNKQLGASLSSPHGKVPSPTANASLGQAGADEDPVELARAITQHYDRTAHISIKLNAKALQTCQTLLKVREAQSMYATKQYEQALSALATTTLLPLQSGVDVLAITRKAEEFPSLSSAIAANFSDILLLAMNSLYHLHDEMKMADQTDTNTVNVCMIVTQDWHALIFHRSSKKSGPKHVP